MSDPRRLTDDELETLCAANMAFDEPCEDEPSLAAVDQWATEHGVTLVSNELWRRINDRQKRLAGLLRMFHNPESCRYPNVPCDPCEVLAEVAS